MLGLNKVYNMDCIEGMRLIDDNSIDSIVTDPPYELGFMGKSWDNTGISNNKEMWAECLRILKPGGYLLSFGGTRTYHRMACAIEDAGFEVRDMIEWVYGCLSEDTEILTKDGWKHYNKINGNNPVFCYNVDKDIFEYHLPTNYFLYENKHTAYRIQSDTTDQIVSRNHRVAVEQDGRIIFKYAETLKQQENIPVLESMPEMGETFGNEYKRTSYKEQILLGLCVKSYIREKEMKTEGIKLYVGDDMSGMLKAIYDEEEETLKVLLSEMQLNSEMKGVNEALTQVKVLMDGKIKAIIQSKDVMTELQVLEELRNTYEKEMKICKSDDKICEVSNGIYGDGEKGLICDGTQTKSSDGNMKTFDKDGVCTSYKPQCGGQQDGEPNVIQNELRTQELGEMKKYKTTLATVTETEYNGIVWCVEVPTGCFVARRNGKIFITGNSGFPKSLNIGKAIDKHGGQSVGWFGKRILDWRKKNNITLKQLSIAIIDLCKNEASAIATINNRELNKNLPTASQFTRIIKEFNLPFNNLEEVRREIIGINDNCGTINSGGKSIFGIGAVGKEVNITKGTSEREGWGTALKPAHEPICMARKPIAEKTVAENVLKYGTGGINIETSRVTSNSPALQNSQDYENVCNEFSYIQQSYLSSLSDTFFLSHESSQCYLKHIFFVLSPYNNCDTITLHTEEVLAHTFDKGLQDALCGYGLTVQRVDEYVQSVIKAPNFQDDYPTLFSFYDALLQKKVIPFKDIVALSNDVQVYIFDFINSGENITPSCNSLLSSFFVVFPYIMMLINKTPTLYLFHQQKQENVGRFPANLIHDNSEEVRECFPDSKGGAFPKTHGSSGFVSPEEKQSRVEMNDSGNASRFFKSIVYKAKASKSERNKGLDLHKLISIMGLDLSSNNPLGSTEQPDQNQLHLLDIDLSPQKEGSECEIKIKKGKDLSMSLYEKLLTDQYLNDYKSTIKTTTNGTTTLTTLNWLRHCITKEYIADVNGEIEFGESLVEIVEGGKKSTTTIKGKLGYLLGVKNVVAEMQLIIKEKENKNHHSTVKPIALMEYLIKMVTPKCGVVLDPFMGSGTTGCASKKNGYNYIGFELDKGYREIANKRIQSIQSQLF